MEKIENKVEDEAEGTDCINAVVGFVIKYYIIILNKYS